MGWFFFQSFLSDCTYWDHNCKTSLIPKSRLWIIHNPQTQTWARGKRLAKCKFTQISLVPCLESMGNIQLFTDLLTRDGTAECSPFHSIQWSELETPFSALPGAGLPWANHRQAPLGRRAPLPVGGEHNTLGGGGGSLKQKKNAAP